MFKNPRSLKAVMQSSTALISFIAAMGLSTTPAHAIVGNDAYPPDSLVDTNDVTGVGQMIVDEGGGYVGLCTASLINPRTVIMAAHCVNEAPASAYGAANGGIPISFGFRADTIPGISSWFRNDYKTDAANYHYNSNYVAYNQHSLDLGPGNNFLQSDVAMAALDTPATNIPTWTLLFSPLTAPTHATLIGYGDYGTGTTGKDDLDFRRRVAENTISFLGSLDDIDGFLFGSPDGLPQNLYMLDFNDPKFNTDDANAYDFNIFHDAALTKEAITAPGDSGGPLVVDQLFSKQVIAAVLSGGSRYYSGQPQASYGTTSFYQPLYVFWDWIVENNPYKYVSAKAGDGLWSDPDHWVVDLDPNYVTIVDGKLVNALPTEPAQGTPPVDGVNTPKFGQVCYFDDCADITTSEGSGADSGKSISRIVTSSPAQVALDSLVQAFNQANTNVSSSVAAMRDRIMHGPMAIRAMDPIIQAKISAGQLAGATMPGDSNFVPDDTDGDSVAGAPPRYYDVTLSANGMTTLDAGVAVIDRLTINGAHSGLTIANGAGLGMMIDTTMYAGNLRVDGILLSEGDLALMGGVLSGRGTVIAPYTTAVLGAIAPATVGTTGTLTMQSNVVLSSGSGVLIDIAPSANDTLDIYGDLVAGGTLVVTPVGGFVPKWHEQRQVIYADTITGAFTNVPDTIPGVLYPTVHTVTIANNSGSYDTEVVTFEAADVVTVLNNATDDQKAVGGGLDHARSTHASDLSPIYSLLDPLSGGQAASVLEKLTPEATRALPTSAQLLSDTHTSFVWQYLGGMNAGADGHVAVQTSALKLAQNDFNSSVQTRGLLDSLGSWSPSVASPLAALAADGQGGMKLPKGMGAFLSGQVIDGTVKIAGDGGKADINGYMVAFGVDYPIVQNLRVGVSFGFGEAKATLRDSPASTNTNMKQAVVYGRFDNGNYFLDGFAGASIEAMHTERDVVLGPTTYHLVGHTSGFSPAFGLQLGTTYDLLAGQFLPALGVQYARPNVDGYTETGGLPALDVSSFGRSEFNGRLGFDARWSLEAGDFVVKPDLHAFWVNKIAGTNAPVVTTAFVVAPDSPMTFAVAPSSTQWAELGVGAQVGLWEIATLGVHYEANPGRTDANYSAWTGSLRVDF